MINFFRKIRRQLANENKFQKYFRYAFGEITLVVIGILIALQVNNWNEKRKQQKQFDTLIAKVYTIINSNTQLMYTFSDRAMQDFRLLEYFINYKNPDSNIFKLEEVRERFTSDTLYDDPLLNFNVKKLPCQKYQIYNRANIIFLRGRQNGQTSLPRLFQRQQTVG